MAKAGELQGGHGPGSGKAPEPARAYPFATSARAVHRHLEGSANVTHPIVGEPTEATDQDCNRDTFHGVKIDRRTAGDRVDIGVKKHFAR
jgi:hypothetical protein